MTYRQEKRIFYNWLRGRNLLEIYKKRCDQNDLWSRHHSKKLRIGDNFIFNAFYWAETPEKHYFWLHLDMKWRKHLNRKRRKYNQH